MGRQETAPPKSDQDWVGEAWEEIRHGKTTVGLVVKVIGGLIVVVLAAALGIGGSSFKADDPVSGRSAVGINAETPPALRQEEPPSSISDKEKLPSFADKEPAGSKQDLPQPVVAASAGRRLFMIPACDAASREAHNQNLGEACRTMIEDAIARQGGRIVERKKLDAILEETSFQQYSGLVDPASAIKIGRLLGANFLALTTVVNADVQKKSFSGYGIRTKSLVYEVSLRLRVVDVQSGEVVFSETSEGSSTETSSKYGGVEQTDGFFAALRDAVERMDLRRLANSRG